jgi:peptide subunit release factor 1 (eRF1)
VRAALESVAQALKKAPRSENGFFLFSSLSGSVYVPSPRPLRSLVYRCDNQFQTHMVREMLDAMGAHKIGVILCDGSESALGLVQRKDVTVLHVFKSYAHGRTRRGGMSALRIARIRDEVRLICMRRDADEPYFREGGTCAREKALRRSR